jgi:hypothetical protein
MKRTPRTKAGKQAKAGEVMSEYAKGTLRSGSPTGPKVKNRKQAMAIAMNESGQGRRGKRGR